MKLLDTLKALSMAQKLALAGALAGVVIAMTMLMQGAVKQPMGLLYSGLDPMHTGEVLAELENAVSTTRFAARRSLFPIPSVIRFASRSQRTGCPNNPCGDTNCWTM